MDVVSYALAKKKMASLEAGIDHWEIDDVEKTLTVYCLNGQTLTLHFDQPAGIAHVDITADNHLVITYTNGVTEVTDAEVPTVEGYSPTIAVYRNQNDEYILRVTNKAGSYYTPNLKGHDGADGKSFTIKSQYATYADLVAAHPTGNAGDAYFVGTDSNPDVYVWLVDDNEWFNAGKITGVKGDPGRGISHFEISNDEHLLVYMDDQTVEDAGEIPVIHFEIVDELPVTDISLITIYLVPIDDAEGESLYEEWIYVWNDTEEEYQWEKLGSQEIDAEAKLKAAMTSTKAVGGVAVGKTWAQGTELETILRDVLSPVLYPTLTNPSASLSKSPSTTLLEKGATLAVAFTVNLNRGSINPAYGTSGYRSGPANGYGLNGSEKQVSNTFSETVTESNNTFYGTAYYDQGEQPLDSSGQPFNSPLPSGNCNSGVTTYEFVNAIWSNAANINTVAKESLVSKSAGNKIFNFPSQTLSAVETFDIPASWTVTGVLVKNDLSGQFEDCSSEFTISNTTHDDAGGVSTNYKRYTDNRGYAAGPRTIKVTWS